MSDQALSLDEFYEHDHETPAAALAEARDADPEPRQTQLVQRWRVDALKPNEHNGGLFPDSLSGESIELLSEELRKRGLKTPIRVRPDGTILDGERRWRAATLLGWDLIDVIVEDVPDDEILGAVLGFAWSARQMTLREQVYVYRASVEQLKREAGRSQGRPKSQSSPKEEEYLSPQEIRTQAAKQARFSSAKHAERADAVFARAPQDLLEKVVLGEVSVTAAYAQIPKQERAKPTAKGSPSQAAAAAVPESLSASDLGVRPPTRANPFAAMQGGRTPGGTPATESSSEEDPPRNAGVGTGRPTSPADPQPPPAAPAPPSAPSDEALLEDQDEVQPSDHLQALCAHLERLRAGADGDQLTEEERYEGARYTAEVMAERLWAAVGEPPEPVEEDDAVVEDDDEEFFPVED